MPFAPRPMPDRDQFLADNPGLEERFWTKVEKGNPPYSGCLEWTGANRNGYGYFSANLSGRHQMVLTHRVAYLLAHGSISDNLYICHLCDNKPCVRPDHLIAATHAFNLKDMGMSRRTRRDAKKGRWTISEIVAGKIPKRDLEEVGD